MPGNDSDKESKTRYRYIFFLSYQFDTRLRRTKFQEDNTQTKQGHRFKADLQSLDDYGPLQIQRSHRGNFLPSPKRARALAGMVGLVKMFRKGRLDATLKPALAKVTTSQPLRMNTRSQFFTAVMLKQQCTDAKDIM